MAQKFSGATLNRDFIDKLKGRTNAIITEGKRNESAPDKSSLEKLTITKDDGTTEDIYVSAKDKEFYEKINYVIGLLDFGEFELSQVYDLPGIKIKIGGTTSSFRILLPILEAPSIVERILSSKITELMDIEFPQEFYRLHSYFSKEHEAKLPDIDMDAPRPRKGNETFEEYEKYLEEEYKKHGVEKTTDAGTSWRMPYPHEKVDFKNELDNKDKKSTPGISKVEDKNQSGYYPTYVEHQQETKGKHKEASAGRHKVTGSRVSTILGTSKNFIQNLLKARLVNLGISKYFIAGAAGIGVSTLILGGGVVTALSAAAVAAGAVKFIDMVKYGRLGTKRKPKTKTRPEPETHEPHVEGVDEPSDEPELEIELEDLEGLRREIEINLNQIKELAAKYETLNNQLRELMQNPDDNAIQIEQIKNEMTNTIEALKQLSSDNEEIMSNYMESVNKKGRSL